MSECVSECCTERLNNERGTASYEMVGLYVPQGVDNGGVAPPQENGMTQYAKSGLFRNKCKMHVKGLS